MPNTVADHNTQLIRNAQICPLTSASAYTEFALFYFLVFFVCLNTGFNLNSEASATFNFLPHLVKNLFLWVVCHSSSFH